MTLAPSRANSLAISNPIPPAAPVTKATCFLMSNTFPLRIEYRLAYSEISFCFFINLFNCDTILKLRQCHAAVHKIKYSQIRNQPVHDFLACQRKGACFFTFDSPCLLTCSMMTTIRFAPLTRSMAPPIPFYHFARDHPIGQIPCSETSIPPRIAKSICPPLIIANDSALSK